MSNYEALKEVLETIEQNVERRDYVGFRCRLWRPQIIQLLHKADDLEPELVEYIRKHLINIVQ